MSGKSHEAISGFSRTRKRQGWPLRGPLESFGMEKTEKMVPTEVVGCILPGGWEGKMEILA